MSSISSYIKTSVRCPPLIPIARICKSTFRTVIGPSLVPKPTTTVTGTLRCQTSSFTTVPFTITTVVQKLIYTLELFTSPSTSDAVSVDPKYSFSGNRKLTISRKLKPITVTLTNHITTIDTTVAPFGITSLAFNRSHCIRVITGLLR